jgi:phosphoglycerate dehydrogenase-like enzyme
MDFKVGLTRDLSNGAGGFSWGEIAIETLSPLSWEFMNNSEPYLKPADLIGYHGIAFAGVGVNAESFGSQEDSPLVISRFGVGYDNVDLAACTRAGVALTITPDGSKKPVATAALTLMLGTMFRLVAKDHQARTFDWANRIQGLGTGVNGKTIGTIGLGNVASEFFRLLSPFEARRLAFDPWKKPEEAAAMDVGLVDLNTLLKECDVVIVTAALTPESRHMLSTAQFAAMKSTAILINISRGPIVDEAALISALENQVIAGAGLDVFEVEPIAHDNPLMKMSNVIVTPHNLAWTDELALGMGKSAFGSISSISRGEIPQFVVNKDVLDTPQFQSKLSKFLS